MDAHRYNSRRTRAPGHRCGRGRRRGRGRGHRARGRGRRGTGARAQAWARAQAQARARAQGHRRAGAGVGAGTGTGAGADAGRRRGCGRWAQAGIRCAKSKGNLRRIAYRRAHNGFRAQGRVKCGGTATGNHWGCRRAASSAPQQANGSRNRLPFVRCDCNMRFSVMGQPASGADAYEFYSIPRRRF